MDKDALKTLAEIMLVIERDQRIRKYDLSLTVDHNDSIGKNVKKIAYR